MSIKTLEITIEGVSALLMHRFPLEPVEAIEKKDVAEQAELSAYRLDGPASNLYVPAINLQRALIAGAAFSKGKGRASLQKPAAACLLVAPEHLDLGTAKYSIDTRPVVVPATKGRILRHRPRLDRWRLGFTLDYDDVLLNGEQCRRIVDDTGSRVGLLDFRPERKGPFGRFMVVEWAA